MDISSSWWVVEGLRFIVHFGPSGLNLRYLMLLFMPSTYAASAFHQVSHMNKSRGMSPHVKQGRGTSWEAMSVLER